jgi:FecR protein
LVGRVLSKFLPAEWAASASGSVGFDLHSFSQFDHADAVTVPDAHLLFSGDYARSGNDLIISDHLHRFVLPNYFLGEKRPALVSPDGAPFDSRVVDALTGHVAYAQAAAVAPGAKVCGHIVKMTGSASIVRNGIAIVANTGDTLYQNDVVETGSNSTLGLVLDDGTAFNLSASARFMLNDFVYEANGTSNHSLVSLIQGAATFVAGQIAPTGDMEVSTPVAVIGVRGTAVILDINATDGQVSISVADQQDGQVHSVQVFKCSPTGLQGVCTAGDPIGTVASNGATLTLTPAPNFQVTTQETNKTAGQVAQEFNSFQQVLSTYDAGKQQFPNLPQHTENTNQNNNSNTATTKTALGSAPAQPVELTSTSVFADTGTTKTLSGGSIVPATLSIDSSASTGVVSSTTTSQQSSTAPLILVVNPNQPIAIFSPGGTTNQASQLITGTVDPALVGTTVTLVDTYDGVTTKSERRPLAQEGFSPPP